MKKSNEGIESTSSLYKLRNNLDISLLAREALDGILSHLQIKLIIRDGLMAIRTTIRKLLNQMLFKFLLFPMFISSNHSEPFTATSNPKILRTIIKRPRRIMQSPSALPGGKLHLRPIALRLMRASIKVNAKPRKQAPQIAKKPGLNAPDRSLSAPRR